MVSLCTGYAKGGFHHVEAINILVLFRVASTLCIVLYFANFKTGKDICVQRKNTISPIIFVNGIYRRTERELRTIQCVVVIDRFILDPTRIWKLRSHLLELCNEGRRGHR